MAARNDIAGLLVPENQINKYNISCTLFQFQSTTKVSGIETVKKKGH